MFDKKLIILSVIVLLIIAIFAIFKFTDIGNNFLTNYGNGSWLWAIVAIAAIIDSINPCAISVLLVTIAFLFSTGAVRNHVLKIGGVYIFGIFLIYIFIGLGILQTLTVFGVPNIATKIGATVLIIFGAINLINDFFPAFPIKLKIPEIAKGRIASLMGKATIPATFLLGAFVGLSEFPCTGGPYLIVLGLLHDNRTFLSGFGYLIIYNLIFVLPLIIILLIGSDKALITKVEDWKKKNNKGMKFWGGLAMIGLGIIMLVL